MRAEAAPDRHRVAGMTSLRWLRVGHCDQALVQAGKGARGHRLTCTIYTLGSPHRDQEHGQQRSASPRRQGDSPKHFPSLPRGHPIIGVISIDVSASAFRLGSPAEGKGSKGTSTTGGHSSGNTLSQHPQGHVGTSHRERRGILRRKGIEWTGAGRIAADDVIGEGRCIRRSK